MIGERTKEGPRRAIADLRADPERGLTTAEADARRAQAGANEVPEKRENRLLLLARKFWGLSAWMIEGIVVLSLVLHKWADAWVGFGLLIVNAALSFFQEQRASAAVTALRSKLHVTARALRNGAWAPVAARDLVPGDVVRVRAGDFVPADLVILNGRLRVDQSALTGESAEIEKGIDEPVYSGSLVRREEATAVVVAIGKQTFYGRTTELVDTARPKLHIEEVVSRVVRWLLIIVATLVTAAFATAAARGFRLIEILPLSLVLLMSAVPVALPVMFTVSMAVGSIELGKRGVLVTRLSAAEDAAHMDVLCADKTGTLTMNRLAITGTIPRPGFTEDEILRDGALAALEANQDPIDLAFIRAANERGLVPATVERRSFSPFSPETRRTEAVVEMAGQVRRVVKGALRTVAELAAVAPDEIAALEREADQRAASGFRVLAVAAATERGPLRLLGLALLHDPPREDSRRLIAELGALGVGVKMLTGDALPVAKRIAEELGLGEIARAPEIRGATPAAAAERLARIQGLAEVFPEDKFQVVKGLQAARHVVGMTGDGVNDAPALRQAEVGIAVGGASDVAKGAASVVLTGEGLAAIVDLVKNGRAIYQRVLTWIVNKVSRTILKAGFVVGAFLVTGRFVVSALAMVLLVFLTDFVKIALATDHVRPSSKPETWDIGPLVRVAVVLGVLMLAESLAVLAIGWRLYDLAGAPHRLQTFSFQILLFFALFSIVSIRERRAFWRSRPSRSLALALAADGLVGLSIGFRGVAELGALPFGATLLVVGCAATFSLVLNDWVKVRLNRKVGDR